ncbi:MAG: DNA repair protein RecN, partial [Acidobacteria bacterium]|nr:DNA repair protein RecN [Acidobacteriota bacterium]
MLVELRLENFAVIENVAVEFGRGLNLLTGETGAGKSMLIDALALLLGGKASTDVVRFGAERAVVSAVFQMESGPEKAGARILEENGIDAEDSAIILRREISGKGRVFVNNQPATVALLKQLAPHLASIHAQNESLVSFDSSARLELLDQFAGTLLDRLKPAYENWNEIKSRIDNLEQGEQERLRQVDLWTFQMREIADAKLQPGEDERLEVEKRVLANAEKIYSAAMNAFDLLYEGASSTSATLRSAQRQVEELVRYEPKFQDAFASLESARISVEDVGASLRDYAGGIESSPEHLAQIEDRLALVDRLKRKYGPTLQDVVDLGREVSEKLSDVQNKDQILEQLRNDLLKAGDEYLEHARSTSKKRYEAAKKLEKLVESEMNQLAMKGRFAIELSGTDEDSNWTSTGFDQAEYLISTNPGEPLHPLAEIASGGELSRVMLALKASAESGAVKKRPSERTLVFDEIDTGIGGRAADAVGRKLKDLSRAHQVICVTHLPQIAAFAD